MEPLLNKSCIFCVLLVFFCPAVTAPGRVIYVDDDATGASNGASWQDAYHYLQDALTDANSAGKPVEIRVAQGIYKPDQGANQTAGDRTATFELINGVAIRGGYAGFGEADPNARDIEAYDTILSGDLAGNDTDVNNPRHLLEEPSRTENSFHVVTATATGSTAVLDGFRVTGAFATGTTTSNGGGMYNWSASPTVTECTFSATAPPALGAGCSALKAARRSKTASSLGTQRATVEEWRMETAIQY